jgi:hypothetical protein
MLVVTGSPDHLHLPSLGSPFRAFDDFQTPQSDRQAAIGVEKSQYWQ